MNAEEVKLGGYQILTLILLSVNFVVVAMSHALAIFYKYTPKFYCHEDTGPEVDVRNRTYGCSAHEAGCLGRYAFEPDYERSVATEWQLVCDRDHLLRTASDVYFAGLLLGSLVAGLVADRIGRLPVLAICLYAQGTMAVALNVVQEFQLFLVFRALQGFFIQGLESCTFILCMELFPTKFRTLIALIILSMRAFGLVILSGLSYAFPDWRILQLVVSVPTAVTVLYIWIIPESPRWLLAKGKSMDAEMLLERIVNYNRLFGLRKKNEDNERAQDRQQQSSDDSADREKPQKPIRKRRATSADAKSAADVAKSLEESKKLLPESTMPAHPDTEERKEEQQSHADAEKQTNLPSELDIDEIAKASLMILTDERSPSNVKSESETGPSYLLVTKEALLNNEANNCSNKKMGFLESRFIGVTCVILMCLWFTSSTAFHSLIVVPQRLSSQRHVSLAIAAGIEIGTFVFVFLLVTSRCGRRGPLCALQIIVGAACLVLGEMTLANDSGPHWIALAKTTIVRVGRVANIGTFFILRLIVIELFPTISRGTGVGLCLGAEMLGGLLMPLIFKLNIIQVELPRFLIGTICICMGLTSLLFPETSGTVLPDSVKEAKSLGQKGKKIEAAKNPEVLREKLFTEDWVDAGNGIIVNFTENENSE